VAGGKQRGIDRDARHENLKCAVRRGRLDLVGEEYAKTKHRHDSVEDDEHDQCRNECTGRIADNGHDGAPLMRQPNRCPRRNFGPKLPADGCAAVNARPERGKSGRGGL